MVLTLLTPFLRCSGNSHWSTATQDVMADDFDFEKHLKVSRTRRTDRRPRSGTPRADLSSPVSSTSSARPTRTVSAAVTSA